MSKDHSKLVISWFVGTSGPIQHIRGIRWSILKAVGFTTCPYPGFQVMVATVPFGVLCRLEKGVPLCSNERHSTTHSHTAWWVTMGVGSQPQSPRGRYRPVSEVACGSAGVP